MTRVAPAFSELLREIAEHSGRSGVAVDVTALGITDRGGELRLGRPGMRSPNGACRLVPAADGWIAVNLARDEDRELVPAWLGCGFDVEPWGAISAIVGGRRQRDLLVGAAELGLPVSGVGEVREGSLQPPLIRLGEPSAGRDGPPKVLDLSALWAGPLCGAVLAAAGAHVTRIENLARPDPTRRSTPGLFQRLNGAKQELRLDLSQAPGRARLRELALEADVVITSARPRGLASLGLSPEEIMPARAGLVWAAITGYGWTGEAAARVAFGDDAAGAGGLVAWSIDGSPRFLGDALADPLTGLAAAGGVLRALGQGGGLLVDAALARTAAGAARACSLRRAA